MIDAFFFLFVTLWPVLAHAVTDKSPELYGVLTYTWVIGIAALGGVTSFVSKVQRGEARAFNIIELVGELFISAFAGVITFYLCELVELPPLASAACVGIVGHMGSRGMFVLEKTVERILKGKLKLTIEDKEND